MRSVLSLACLSALALVVWGSSVGQLRAQGANVALGKLATQSSQGGAFVAGLAVDGNLGNFTHTAANADLPGPAWWQVDIGEPLEIGVVVLHNRTSCCGSRLRDIIVQILDSDGATVLFETTDPADPDPGALLNPENSLGAFPLGPGSLTVNVQELTGDAVEGQIVRVLRLPDTDLSGTGGQGNADEGTVLSLGEVEVFAEVPECPVAGDTHCSGIEAEGPAGGKTVGLWTLTATAADDSGDPITYNFKATHEGGATVTSTSIAVGSTTLDLYLSGAWTLSVMVDDTSFCSDAAADATCELPVTVAGLPGFTDETGRILSKAFLVLGPFTHTFGCGGAPALFLGNHIADARIDCEYPVEGDPIAYDPAAAVTEGYLGPEPDGIPTWRAFDDGTLENGDQDLNGDIGQRDNVMSWLVTYVEYLGDDPADIEICLGSDDGGQMWLDGRLLANDTICRVVGDCNVRVPVTVEPGVHRIAAASWNATGGWAVRLSLQDPVLFSPILDDAELFPDWDFHGPAPPAGFIPPTCVDPVAIVLCELQGEEVELAWENHPGAAGPITITANGVLAEQLPATATSAVLAVSDLPPGDPIRLCVENGAPVPACCLVSASIAVGKMADQSSTLGAYTADRGTNGDLGDFTHTLAGNSGLGPAIWEVDLGATVAIERIVLQNRDSCCGSRLRDIVVSVHWIPFRQDEALDPSIGEVADATFPIWDGALFESGILNEDNELGSFPLGPESLEVIPDEPLEGRYVRVTRIPDRDLSGTNLQGNADEADVLALGEVQVFASVGPREICDNGTDDDGDGDIDCADSGCAGKPPCPTGVRFRRGDADAVEGVVNITDAIFLLSYLFRGGGEPPCLDAADADDEFGVNISDGIYILNYLFSGGVAPPAPGPEACGVDPAPDGQSDPGLDCKSYPPCT